MNIVFLLDAKTQNSYPIKRFESSEEALDFKDMMMLEYKDLLFYSSILADSPIYIYDIEEAINIISREAKKEHVQS